MSEAVLIAALAGVPGIVAAYFAYRGSIKAAERSNKARALEVEAAAYERARKLYEAGIDQLEEQVRRLREQVNDEQKVSDTLRGRIKDLEDTIDTLRSQLGRAGIDLSPMEKQ